MNTTIYNNFKDFGKAFKLRYNKYSPEQEFLVKRCLYGLRLYSKEEIAEMHKQKLHRIKKVYTKAQIELNLFKQERLHELHQDFFESFCNSELTKNLALYVDIDDKFVCTLSFKDLKITKDEIIQRLYDKGLLPRNFFELGE